MNWHHQTSWMVHHAFAHLRSTSSQQQSVFCRPPLPTRVQKSSWYVCSRILRAWRVHHFGSPVFVGAKGAIRERPALLAPSTDFEGGQHGDHNNDGMISRVSGIHSSLPVHLAPEIISTASKLLPRDKSVTWWHWSSPTPDTSTSCTPTGSTVTRVGQESSESPWSCISNKLYSP